ncbi:AAA family ATPase [Actinomycetospora sp. CA-101289]|uniref:AAA family ATPase n=1 Tax=Actinomycetospora sp. CA-101289 TaxID=3239893 RepID=UPI003D97D982
MTVLAHGRDYVDPFAADDASRTFEHEVTVELQRLEVRDEARRRHTAQRGDEQEAPAPVLLTDFLAQPSREQQWRIDGLLPSGARALLAAPWKAGKSTLVGNLVRCLVDGDPFLDRYTVTPTERRVVILDDELDPDALRRWLREQNIAGTDRVAVVPLRGKVATLDLLDPTTRGQWADTLAALDPGVIVLDCLRPVLDALGLDEKSEAGRFLVAFDELIDRAGADEAVVIHHMGHSGERSRGDSRLRDWPDVEWRIVRQDADDPASPRYFTAFGRDVDQAEQQLAYDPDTRHLSVNGGSRQDAAGVAVVPALLELLADEPGLTGRQIEERLRAAGEGQKAIRSAIKAALADGSIDTVKGARGARCHHLPDGSASVRPTASPVRRHGESECVSASIEDALTRSNAENPSASSDALVCDRCGAETTRPPDDSGRRLCQRHAYPLDDEEDDQ